MEHQEQDTRSNKVGPDATALLDSCASYSDTSANWLVTTGAHEESGMQPLYGLSVGGEAHI